MKPGPPPSVSTSHLKVKKGEKREDVLCRSLLRPPDVARGGSPRSAPQGPIRPVLSVSPFPVLV